MEFPRRSRRGELATKPWRPYRRHDPRRRPPHLPRAGDRLPEMAPPRLALRALLERAEELPREWLQCLHKESVEPLHLEPSPACEADARQLKFLSKITSFPSSSTCVGGTGARTSSTRRSSEFLF